MAKPAKEYPKNLFNTWLAFRKSHGESRADVIRFINLRLNRNYDNALVYRWCNQQNAVPDKIISDLIYPELSEVLKWVFEVENFNEENIDFLELALLIRPPVKL